MERQESRGRRWRFGPRHNPSCNPRLHRSQARACKNVTIHNLDRGCGTRNRRWGRQRRGAAIGTGGQAGKRGRIHDKRATRAVRKRELGEGAGHRSGFMARFQGPGGVEVIGRQGSKSVGFRKTRFQCGQRLKLGHSAVNGPGRPQGTEYLRPVAFHLAFSLRDQGRTRGRSDLKPLSVTETPRKNKTVNRKAPHGPAAAGRARGSTRSV